MAVIVDNATDFVRALESLPPPVLPAPAPKRVLMIEPQGFHLASESAEDNHYMHLELPVRPERALRQFRGVVSMIEGAGVPVTVFPGRYETPDDIFPNNVYATVPGRFIVGSMYHDCRRPESRREDIRDYFTRKLGYELLDLSELDCIAELTGCLVIDHGRNIGFCGMSHRVNISGARAMHEAFGLDLTYCFELDEEEYHTNVVMSVLAGRACVFHPGAFADGSTAGAIEAAFPGRCLLLNDTEKEAFAGNCIALSHEDLFISETALRALRPSSLATLRGWGFTLHAAPPDELEKAGGSIRCLVAEVF